MKKLPNAKQLKEGITSRVKRGQEVMDDEETIDQANDILEEFNIDLSVKVKEDVYTPEKVSSVLFSISKPQGYKTDEVEKFVDETEYSIEYYIQYIEDKNEDIYTLANEVNQLRTQIENYRAQIALHRARGVAVVDDKGEFVKEKVIKNDSSNQDNDIDTSHFEDEINNLTLQLNDKLEELQILQEDYDTLQEYVTQMETYSAELEEKLSENVSGEESEYEEDTEQYFDDENLDDFIDEENNEFADEYNELELSTDVQELQKQIEEFNVWGDEMEQNLLEATEARERAEEELENLQAEFEEQQKAGNSTELQHELEDLTEKFSVSEAEKTELYNEYEEVANTVNQQTEHITKMEEYATSLEQEIERLEKEQKNKDNIIAKLKKEIKDLQNNTADEEIELDSDRNRRSHSPVRQQEKENSQPKPTRAKKSEFPSQNKRKLTPQDILSSELDD